jgi:hypothetical protein
VYEEPCASATCRKLSSAGRVEHRNSQYALYAAACARGGLQPDRLHGPAGWWQTHLSTYAVCAAVILIRASAARRNTTLEQVGHDLGARHGLVEDVDVPVRPDGTVRRQTRHRRSTTVNTSDSLIS